MSQQRDPRQLWIGAVEVRATQRNHDILTDAKGAFVNIVTWASDLREYKRNAEIIMSNLGLFISEVLNPEAVDVRRRRGVVFNEEIADLIARAQDNRHAIVYGTFHLFQKENA